MKEGFLPCLLCLIILALPAAAAPAGEVTLSAAASLKDVCNELAEAFVRTHPGVKVLRNYGASGTLAKQIESGAPADIFISANPEWVEHLKERKLLDSGSVSTFARNTLVFAGLPRKSISSMADLPRLERIAIGSPKSVPAGEYAVEALKNAGIDRRLEGKLVMARDARECLVYAERGEVDGAFVYRTDALLAKRTKILFAVPRDLYPEVTYRMGLTATGARNAEAAAFFNHLRSGVGKALLDRFGFMVQ